MSQHKEDEPTDKEEKNELLPLNCRVSELTLACGCLKWGQEKHFYGMDFLESHASLFHAVRSVVKSWRKAVEYKRGKHLAVKKSDGSPWEEDVVKEYFSILKDKKEDKDTVTRQHSKPICRSVHSKHLMSKSRSVIFRKQRKPGLEELPPSSLFPYLVLIKNCVPLPLSILQRLCLSGEILCKIQYFSQKHRKKKEVTLPESERPVPKPQTETEEKYVTFDSLKELQWMLFKGLVKRKPKTVGMWREPAYSFGIQCVAPVKKAEYILPLIPKDWIIDDSLKFSEEMTHLLLQYNPRS